MYVNNEPKRELKIGEGFGELALLYNSKRTASIKAIEHSYLWGIDRNVFRAAVEELNSREHDENRKFIEKIKFCCNDTILLIYNYST